MDESSFFYFQRLADVNLISFLFDRQVKVGQPEDEGQTISSRISDPLHSQNIPKESLEDESRSIDRSHATANISKYHNLSHLLLG